VDYEEILRLLKEIESNIGLTRERIHDLITSVFDHSVDLENPAWREPVGIEPYDLPYKLIDLKKLVGLVKCSVSTIQD